MDYMHAFRVYVEAYVHRRGIYAYMQTCLGAYNIYAGIHACMRARNDGSIYACMLIRIYAYMHAYM